MSNNPDKRNLNKIQKNTSLKVPNQKNRSKASSKNVRKSQFFKNSTKNVSQFAKGLSQNSKTGEGDSIKFKNKQNDFEDDDSEYDSADNDN